MRLSESQMYTLLDELYTSMYEAEIVISPGGKMGRDDKNSMDAHGGDVGMAGAPSRSPQHSANERMAANAKKNDPLNKADAEAMKRLNQRHKVDSALDTELKKIRGQQTTAKSQSSDTPTRKLNKNKFVRARNPEDR